SFIFSVPHEPAWHSNTKLRSLIQLSGGATRAGTSHSPYAIWYDAMPLSIRSMSMKTSARFMGAIQSRLLWLALLAALVVLFPFDWLSEIWPAFGSLFDRIFVSAREHAIGHTTLFLIAGLLVFCSIPQVRRYPYLYTVIMILGAVGEEFLQALSR